MTVRLAYRTSNIEVALSWEYLSRLLGLDTISESIEDSINAVIAPLGAQFSLKGEPQLSGQPPPDDPCFRLGQDEIALIVHASLVFGASSVAVILEAPLGFSLVTESKVSSPGLPLLPRIIRVGFVSVSIYVIEIGQH